VANAPGGGGEHRSRIGVVTLELGPGPSARELLGALGDALVRSELVAETIELLPRAGGFVLRATCTVSDELTLIRALRELIHCAVRRDAETGDPPFRRRRCSLAS
jgi:hypothetical protein